MTRICCDLTVSISFVNENYQSVYFKNDSNIFSQFLYVSTCLNFSIQLYLSNVFYLFTLTTSSGQKDPTKLSYLRNVKLARNFDMV
jgi:hypothetical protein